MFPLPPAPSAFLNLTCLESFGDLVVTNNSLTPFTLQSPADAPRIALLHGHEHSRLDRALRSGHYRYLIHGHTHQPRDETTSLSGPPTPHHQTRRHTLAG